MVPDSVGSIIESRLNTSITSARRVSGGSINQAARVEISGEGSCFLKWNTTADSEMFQKEVLGLELLAEAGSGLRVPEVMLQETAGDGTGFLLLEFIEQGSPKKESAGHFGKQLARLHSVTHEQFGLEESNFIGRLPQSNRWHDNWTDFFIEERIDPQLEMALNAGRLNSNIVESFDALYKDLDNIFPKEEPALLHGDLWGGNYFYDSEGQAVIFDPAVYYGHREIEMAFTYLFGGFSSSFYESYNREDPLAPGFENRKDIYNLYPLLVHTNLFGGSYARQVVSIIKRFH